MVRLHLLNTAWMSSINEAPGTLLFPLSEIPESTRDFDIGVAVMHHPLNWFRQPDTMRPLKDRLSSIATVVIVSHEHVADASKEIAIMNENTEGKNLGETIYVHGGVIQENDMPDLCTFNSLNIDAINKSCIIKSFELRVNGGNEFFKCCSEALVPITTFNSGVGSMGAQLTNKFADYLEDPGAPITHPDRNPRKPILLSDIFVCPDLWEFSGKKKNNQQTQIPGEKVISELFKSNRVLIEGLDKSGKTALLKILFQEAVKLGKVPLLVDANKFPKSNENLRNFIRGEVEKTYYKLDPEFFEQLPVSDKIILIDGAHDLCVDSGDREAFVECLEAMFDTVVFCADDFTYQPDASSEFLSTLKVTGYRQFVILGLGEVLREKFVRNWLGLADDALQEVHQEQVDRVCSLINLVIRTQLLPTYPIFILLLLQQSDIQTASVQGGSFGKLFEGVVTAVLYKSKFDRIDIQAKYSYLASYAKTLFDRAEKSISMEAAARWHEEYWESVDMKDEIKFSAISSDLLSLGILVERQNQLSFRYDYYYCFFVAYNISRRLHQAETKELVSELTGSLHHKISADIVLFLVHLTGDPMVINEMINTCDSLFSESPMLDLNGEASQLKNLGKAIGTIRIDDDHERNSENIKKAKDANVRSRILPKQSIDVTPPDPEDERQKYVFQIHAANKSIQILGQALRNISAIADKDIKERSIDSVVRLSRRILGECFEVYGEETIDELVQFIADMQKENNPTVLLEDLKKQVHMHLYGQAQLLCFVIIRNLSHSIGSENLSATVERLLEDSLPVSKLISTNYKLEIRGGEQKFPRSDILNAHQFLLGDDFNIGILRFLVAHHLYLFKVPMQDKQAIASKLDLKLLSRDTSGRYKELKSS